ncbi:5-(carboxyamino)imidazole ribonucleotide synthase [Engelhardtia mirabilis]|uniref:N5-carboxyaminoimidazole ribonucleotide synthase n=1 Tax=Engelhardtia mirabilis TaxID=2528011 RepID=A0A518BRF9_9BACT|nr:N5-carboxyaminoimidazole ribonucleotide synthase [Planctomycetes bacterium Pla133]QDV03885.1 N5-carboxyaminoimidazole ribonucleotide synthase [Planctomycetes bacterium Pla86]
MADQSERVCLPGGTLGVVGGGQLGRMFAVAARQLGYRVIVLDPTPDAPAAAVADRQIVAGFDDVEAAGELAESCDRITFEFENAPAATLTELGRHVPVHPAPRVLEICRQRCLEKAALAGAGFPVAPHRAVASPAEVAAALAELGAGVLKRAEFGYDGKGQARLAPGGDVRAAWEAIGAPRATGDAAPAVFEALVDFEAELSVIVARGAGGETATFPVFENDHANHVLDVTRFPARIDAELANEARALATRIAESLDVVGLLTVELFRTADGLIVNELAPRPHNSGHITIEACDTSQFEQHVRALCGLPLGSTAVRRPGAMVNLLGDLWAAGEPNWSAALAVSGASLHLYGKSQARSGRKMGHICALGDGVDEATERALAARAALTRG